MALPSLQDNISSTLKEFKVETFIDAAEFGEFTGLLHGIEDIVGSLTGIIDFLVGFKDVVFKILDSILNIFDLNSFFDTAGINALSASIFNMTTETMGFGAISKRQEIKDLYSNGCVAYNSALQQEFGTPSINMQSFALSSIMLAMLCNGNTSAYSSLLNMSYGENATDVRVPEPLYLDAEGSYTSVVTNNLDNESDILEAIATNEYRLNERNRLNKTFSKIISPILLNSKEMANLETLEDIKSTGIQNDARLTMPTLGLQSAHYMENVTMKSKEPSLYYDRMKLAIDGFDPDFDKIDGEFNLSKYSDLDNYVSRAGKRVKAEVIRPNFSTNVVSDNISDDVLLLL